ncbi:hypothetical protein EMPS_02503 [Entomortierella parvispora]|uniref:Uncharacterized protein n=1 Tax=Entomortierella parvispora TaxID=205924 RepID=A0A9P3H4U8_9FUNG|nr:hypothetical protein EMPS_02503 [Entomortierella parvispora]
MAFDIRDEDEDHHRDEFDEYEDVKQAKHPKFYRRRKFWMFCIPNAIITLIVAVLLALYVIMPKIAQGLMNKATINFDAINISNPSATSMDITMEGNMRNTGPFSAEISFPETVVVSWNGIELGTTDIPGTSKASGGHGSLSLGSSFKVTNATAFTEFSSYMLNAETFVWHLQGKLNVKALSHTVKGLTLSKDITVNGTPQSSSPDCSSSPLYASPTQPFIPLSLSISHILPIAFNGLSNIKIERFSLPGDDPNGKGILVEIDTSVTNPSALQMYMGSLTLAISYKDVLMGYVTSSNLTMVRGVHTMSMKGVLIPQNTPEGLAVTSEMMSRYIGNVVTNTTATGFEVKPDGVNSLEWLSAAVKNLKLNVPLQSPAPLQLIKGLNLGALGLVFTPPTAYEPVTTSTGVLANYSLPDGFGFNIQFQQVSNSFALTRGGVVIATLNSSYNPSTSDMASGTLTFNLLSTPLLVPDASRQPFQEFNRDLTIGADLPFEVTGQASVYANTSIGVVNLVNIPFNASTQLSGLQSLANPAPTITSLQVVSGTPTGLTMDISVIIVNPSSISLSAGDVVLALMYKGVNLGTVTMPNLAIVPGANTVATTSTIDPSKTPEGLELLTLYTSGAGATVSIAGTPTSTAVESLSLAFGALNIETQMPGLQSKLLAGASLTVLDSTLVDGLAQTVVTVNNPFVPPMTILSIDTKITYNGVSVGTVTSTFATPPVIPGTGQGTITASLAMNIDPHDLITLIRTQALKNGLNTAAFDGLLSLQAGGNPPASLFVGFNVAEFTMKAMAGLQVDIDMTTTVKVGDYQVTMPYTQTGVSTTTDQTILKLIAIVGTPIAQILVDGSALKFDAIQILAPTETSFQTSIKGAISNTGPLDAQIVFPNPVVVSFNDKPIGSMKMPTVNAIANQGATLDLTGVEFTISDIAAYTDFTVYALNNAQFDWTISTTGVVVNAMGAPIPGVSMTKTVTLDGFNMLSSLQLKSYIINTIDAQGMHMTIAASIINPSTIGMTIPATIATGNGDMRPYLTGIFHNALNGEDTHLIAVGTGAPGVSWLDTAIKSLTLETVLPPLSEPPIASVTINAMSMDFTCDSCTYEPMAGSSITAVTNLPFEGKAPLYQLSQNIEILDASDNVVGRLITPYADCVVNGNTVSTNTPPSALVIDEAARDKIYPDFISDLNQLEVYNLGLRGTADSILDLGDLGKIEVKGIKLDVRTPLDGLQGLKKIDMNYVVGFGFADTGANITSIVNIYNPSKLTLHIGELYLKVGLDYSPETYAGVSYMHDLTLVPGDNIMANVAQLDNTAPGFNGVLTGSSLGPLPLAFYAFPGSSPNNKALDAGLQSLKSGTIIPFNLVSPVPALPYGKVFSVKALPNTEQDGIVEITGTWQNPYIGVPTQLITMLPDPSVWQATRLSWTMFNFYGTSLNLFEPLEDYPMTLVDGGKQVTMRAQTIVQGDLSIAKDWMHQAATTNVGMTVIVQPLINVGTPPGYLSNPDFSSGQVYPLDGAAYDAVKWDTWFEAGPDMAKVWQFMLNKLNTTDDQVASNPPVSP